jgi:hypothetical protein
MAQIGEIRQKEVPVGLFVRNFEHRDEFFDRLEVEAAENLSDNGRALGGREIRKGHNVLGQILEEIDVVRADTCTKRFEAINLCLLKRFGEEIVAEAETEDRDGVEMLGDDLKAQNVDGNVQKAHTRPKYYNKLT